MNRLYPNFGRTSALMDWQQWWRELISRKCALSVKYYKKINKFVKNIEDVYHYSKIIEKFSLIKVK